MLHSSWHAEPLRLGHHRPSGVLFSSSGLMPWGMRCSLYGTPWAHRGEPAVPGWADRRSSVSPSHPETQTLRSAGGEGAGRTQHRSPEHSQLQREREDKTSPLPVSYPAGDVRVLNLQGTVTHSWNEGPGVSQSKPEAASMPAPPKQALLRAPPEQLRGSQASLPLPPNAFGGWHKGSEQGRA